MYSTQSPSTPFRRWAIFYIAVLALLTGWWLFEKMPDGKAELTSSVENAFRDGTEAMKINDLKQLKEIQDITEEIPAPYHQDYLNRAKQAIASVAAFEQRCQLQQLPLLHDSMTVLADNDPSVRNIIDLDHPIRSIKHFKALMDKQTIVQSQIVGTSVLNYCRSKMSTGCAFDDRIIAFIPNPIVPVVGEPLKAELFLTEFSSFGWPKYEVVGWLDNKSLSFRDGIAYLRTTFPTSGPHILHLRYRCERCRDGLVTEISRDFQVNVLELCDSVLTH
jgi:hypothetical protein